MSDLVRVDLFAEDSGHEQILRPLIARIADEERVRVRIVVRSARGGASRAMGELALYLRMVDDATLEQPDVFVICIDANCVTYPRKRALIEAAVPAGLRARSVIACPDPHVEKWYLSDPDNLADVFGVRPKVPKKKCERSRYKAALAQAVVDGGNVPTLGGIEFAQEVAMTIDLYRAGKNERSLRQFVSDLRAAFRQFAPD